MSDSRRVLIVGYGEMGRAMEYLLAPRHDLEIWRRPRQGETAGPALAAAAAGHEVIMLCVPALPVHDLAEQLRSSLAPGAITLSIAKGLDDSGRPAAQALGEVYRREHLYGVLYGPMISEEIRRGRPAFAEAGVSEDRAYPALRVLFRGSNLVLRQGDDLNGLSWAAVLKNVYAIAFGVADELDLGDNLRGFLTAQAMDEMEAILVTLGGRAESARRLAGLGDLVTTATSAGSHHHELGRRLARGESGDIAGEGVHTLATVRAKRLFDADRFPLFRLVAQTVESPPAAERLLAEYLTSLG